MRDYEKVEVVKEQPILKSVTCNKCGRRKKIEGDEDFQRDWEAEEFQSFGLRFGYGSKYDEESWEFDLCEDCLTDFIDTFKHLPDGYGEYTR